VLLIHLETDTLHASLATSAFVLSMVYYTDVIPDRNGQTDREKDVTFRKQFRRCCMVKIDPYGIGD